MLRKESMKIIDDLVDNMNAEELGYTYVQALRKRSFENRAIVESLGPKALHLFESLTGIRKQSNVVDTVSKGIMGDSEYLFRGAPNEQSAADERLFSSIGRVGGGLLGAIAGAGAGLAGGLTPSAERSGTQRLLTVLAAGTGALAGGYLGQRVGKVVGGAPIRALNRLDRIAQATDRE